MIKSNLEELYESRCLILMEDNPQSNKYHQLYLDKEQFKKLTELLQTFGTSSTCECGDPNHISKEFKTANYKIDLSNYSEIKSINI